MEKSNTVLIVRLRLAAIWGVVLMQVIEQKGFEAGFTAVHNDMVLSSASHPALSKKRIYIRGSDRYEYNKVTAFTPKNPTTYIKKATALIESVSGIVKYEQK